MILKLRNKIFDTLLRKIYEKNYSHMGNIKKETMTR